MQHLDINYTILPKQDPKLKTCDNFLAKLAEYEDEINDRVIKKMRAQPKPKSFRLKKLFLKFRRQQDECQLFTDNYYQFLKYSR